MHEYMVTWLQVLLARRCINDCAVALPTRRGVFYFLKNVLNFGIIISTRITLKQLFTSHIFKQ